MMNKRLFEYAEKGDLLGVANLLSRGADVNWKNPDWVDQTALHIASSNGHSEVVKKLLGRKEVDPNAMDEFGWTPLHSASFYSHLGVVKELLQISKVDPNVSAKNGWTPLHSASYGGRKEVVNELLQLPQIDLSAKTNKGYTFSDIALKKENLEIIQLPQVVDFLLKELTTLHGELKLAESQLEFDLMGSWNKQGKILKRLKDLKSRLSNIVEPNIQEKMEEILQSEREFSDFKSKIENHMENINTLKTQNQQLIKDVLEMRDVLIKDFSHIDVQRVDTKDTSGVGVDFADLTARFQNNYCDDDYLKQYGSEFDFLCDSNIGDVKAFESNLTSGAFTTFSIVLVFFSVYLIPPYMQYFKENSAKGSFLDNICHLTNLVWNRIMEFLTQGDLSAMHIDKPTAYMSCEEMQIHFEEQLKQLQTVSEFRIRECKSEFAKKLEKLNSEAEKLKSEMAKMKKKISTLTELPKHSEANAVKSIKRARSVGDKRYYRQDSVKKDQTGIIFDQLKSTV